MFIKNSGYKQQIFIVPMINLWFVLFKTWMHKYNDYL